MGEALSPGRRERSRGEPKRLRGDMIRERSDRVKGKNVQTVKHRLLGGVYFHASCTMHVAQALNPPLY
jgi:hypothetical protein